MAKTEDKDTEKTTKKKGGMMKFILLGVGVLVVIAGGIGGGLYAMSSGMIGGGKGGHEVAYDAPRLLPKSEEKRVSAGEAEGGHGGESGASVHRTPMGAGGEKYASTYYAMEKEFTSNLRESVHFIQVGIAISTPYDERIIENVKTHEIAVRSAILLALGDASEEQMFLADGKRKLQVHLAHAINDVLKKKEGFGGVGNVYFTNFVVQ